MTRPRKHDKHLPRSVYHRHGAYYLVRHGKWIRLGTGLRDSLTVYATMFEAPQGSMPALIGEAMQTILPTVKPSTARQYRTAAAKLCAILLEFRPDQVRPKDVAAIKVALASTPNMANRCLSLLRQIMHYALERQMIASNPAIGIRRHVEQKRKRLLTLTEYGAIRAQADERLRAIMDVAVLTGQRISDVLAIRRADLTPEGVAFRQQKTEARLVVAWSSELRAAVDAAKALSPIVGLTLFRNRRGKCPDYRTVRDQWEAACTAGGVADAHLHDLRALSLTLAKSQGRDATALAGHSSPTMTARYLRDRQAPLVQGPSFGQLANVLDGTGRK